MNPWYTVRKVWVSPDRIEYVASKYEVKGWRKRGWCVWSIPFKTEMEARERIRQDLPYPVTLQTLLFNHEGKEEISY